MANFKKEYKKLYQNYNKRLKRLHKHLYAWEQPPVQYFVTYLQFLRDRLLLESPLTEKLGEGNIELASIVTALSEFEKYQTCVENYYIVKGNVVIRRPEFSEAEASEKYQSEKAYHWEAFWNIVKLGIEGWGADAEL